MVGKFTLKEAGGRSLGAGTYRAEREQIAEHIDLDSGGFGKY
jgi:hypothetical protein